MTNNDVEDTMTTEKNADDAPTADAPTRAEEPQEGTAGEEQGKNPNREAAKYRTRLREVETERDTLASQVERLQKAHVELMVQDRLHSPKALWANGTNVADLLDEDGRPDPEKVKEAVSEAVTSLGLAERPRTPKPHPAQRFGDAVPRPDADGMAAAIRGKR